jgi:hypothetical protein
VSVRLLVVLIATIFVSSSAATGAESARPLPIFYDQALAAQGFPNPLVRARIAGHEAIFIVDTGASVNVLADWYAEIAGVPSTSTDTRAQGSGGGAAPLRVARRVQGEWGDGQRFSLNEAIVISFPPYFKSQRLGGLVSPQLLAPAGMAAVLDLGIPSLQFAPYASALSDLRRAKASPAEVTQACRNASSRFVNRLRTVA